MKQTIVPMKPDARLIIRSSADLFIEGSSQSQLIATVNDGDSFRMRDEGSAIYLNSSSDTKLILPEGTSLVIERVGGDASISSMKGKVEVQKVGGDLTLQLMGAISVDTVGGDVLYKDLTGPFEIKRVGGELEGFNVGDISVYFVGGDADISGLLGKVQLSAGGDVRLQFNTPQIMESHVKVGGDIELSVLENTSASLSIQSGGEEITVHACGQEVDLEKETYDLPLGQGGALVQLIAGGDVAVHEGKETVNQFSSVFEDLGDTWRDFGREIEEKVRRSMRGVNQSLRQAGWDASNAVREATDKIDKSFRNFPTENSGKVYGFGFKPENAGPVKEKKAASDEERMLVLKMLQEKKISVEEAEKLLQALEG